MELGFISQGGEVNSYSMPLIKIISDSSIIKASFKFFFFFFLIYYPDF